MTILINLQRRKQKQKTNDPNLNLDFFASNNEFIHAFHVKNKYKIELRISPIYAFANILLKPQNNIYVLKKKYYYNKSIINLNNSFVFQNQKYMKMYKYYM